MHRRVIAVGPTLSGFSVFWECPCHLIVTLTGNEISEVDCLLSPSASQVHSPSLLHGTLGLGQ